MARSIKKASSTPTTRASKRTAAVKDAKDELKSRRNAASVDEEEECTPTSKAAKRNASRDDDDGKPDAAAKASEAWGFLKAPTGPQLKKPKKATPPADDVEFPPITEAEKAVFDSVIPSSATADKDTVRVLAWNVNGLRAVLKSSFRAYIACEDPDVLCLSETKIDDASLGQVKRMLPQYPFQYWNCATQKGYSGTAVFCKTEPLSVRTSLVVDSRPDDEGRYVALEFDTFWLVHTYVPNSGQKLDRLGFRTTKWDPTLFADLRELEKAKPVVWCGDLNVAHEEIDIHDPKGNKRSAGFTNEERASFGSFLASGFVDSFRRLHAHTQAYTYFSYRSDARRKNKGWRLDYFVVSAALMDRVQDSAIRSSIQGSDHLPIVLVLRK
ncbi:exodeoxyribonuclease III, variant [Aphanomyces invadans]|uniref:DNA-(apurinic or apyrimidinic site) endonuclease n=1 Tax=Aphanomyces invadans TaxID=157072 RepID=A0A024TGV1_9STRA|nr:exodeoxyribonuclease III, variant [Aphanomyces invadans]ETV92572.1 exodeoxyribonuclease III, variant [Aphanomyces invadans]|eukprot:XP_008878879.1 exodeoxyribonuclease III, variant [Aphanomyces invadans]